ncbi:MAG: YncE family protein [Fimbriimonas sp.]
MVTLVGAGPTGEDVLLRADRIGGETEPIHYTSASTALTGEHRLVVSFQTANPGGIPGPGGVLATIDMHVRLLANGTLALPDGSSLGTISPQGQVESVTVFNWASPIFDMDRVQLEAIVRNTLGQVFPISADAAQWQLVSGNATLSPTGLIQAKAGTVSVRVTVDGVPSEPLVIQIQGRGFESLNLATTDLAYDALHHRLLATSADGKLYVLDQAKATVTQTVHVGGRLEHLALAKDGTRAFVADNEARRIVVLNLDTLAIESQFKLAEGDPFIATGLATPPNQPNRVVVALGHPDSSVPTFRVTLYDNGVALPESVERQFAAPNKLEFSGTDLIGISTEVSSNPAFLIVIREHGLLLRDTAEYLARDFVTDFAVAGRRIFTSPLTVLEYSPLRTEAQLTDSWVRSSVAADFQGDVAVYMIAQEPSGFTGLRAYDLETYEKVGEIPLAFPWNEAFDLVKTGAHSYAFRTTNYEQQGLVCFVSNVEFPR